jgi:hypothetical protein
MKKQSFKNLSTLLFDKFLDVREAAGWCLVRLSMDRDGVMLLCKNRMPHYMIESFHKFTEIKKYDQKNSRFLIYLLESFFYVLKFYQLLCFNILSYDNGIKFFLGTKMIEKLKKITDKGDMIQ